MNLMMMNKILKNNSKWLKPKPGSTFKICDASHEIEHNIKSKPKKITMENSKPTKIIRDKLKKKLKKK